MHGLIRVEVARSVFFCFVFEQSSFLPCVREGHLAKGGLSLFDSHGRSQTALYLGVSASPEGPSKMMWHYRDTPGYDALSPPYSLTLDKTPAQSAGGQQGAAAKINTAKRVH
jgi:hypothetical protein